MILCQIGGRAKLSVLSAKIDLWGVRGIELLR